MRPCPYLIEGPALISFSGGRTSGYMLKHILDAHGGTLPEDVVVCFANTGKEMPETLDFIQECSEQWGVPIVWLEWRDKKICETSWEQVTHSSASREGEPFKALCDKKQYLPNPITRFCTSELKICVFRDFCKEEKGWEHWDSVIGIRADEPLRVSKSRVASGKERWEIVMPLATAGVTKYDVTKFWAAQPFDLRLKNVNGTTPAGNCDLCFLKGAATIAGLIRENPALADWWAEAEAEARASKPSGAVFRKDRPPYAKMKQMVFDQGDLISGWPNEDALPCMCHD